MPLPMSRGGVAGSGNGIKRGRARPPSPCPRIPSPGAIQIQLGAISSLSAQAREGVRMRAVRHAQGSQGTWRPSTATWLPSRGSSWTERCATRRSSASEGVSLAVALAAAVPPGPSSAASSTRRSSADTVSSRCRSLVSRERDSEDSAREGLAPMAVGKSPSLSTSFLRPRAPQLSSGPRAGAWWSVPESPRRVLRGRESPRVRHTVAVRTAG